MLHKTIESNFIAVYYSTYFIILKFHRSIYPWDEGIAEIQISCGVYSLQDNLSKEKRMQMNTSTGKHLQFLTQMAMDSPVFKQLFKNYHNHYIQVESLVKQMAKEMDQQKQ